MYIHTHTQAGTPIHTLTPYTHTDVYTHTCIYTHRHTHTDIDVYEHSLVMQPYLYTYLHSQSAKRCAIKRTTHRPVELVYV